METRATRRAVRGRFRRSLDDFFDYYQLDKVPTIPPNRSMTAEELREHQIENGRQPLPDPYQPGYGESLDLNYVDVDSLKGTTPSSDHEHDRAREAARMIPYFAADRDRVESDLRLLVDEGELTEEEAREARTLWRRRARSVDRSAIGRSPSVDR